MIIDILSRLPIPSIIRCKCVCKSWLDLVECEEFAKSHLSRSVLSLALFRGEPQPYEIIEIVDELDPQNYQPHCNSVFSFSFPHDGLYFHSSVNGLLFLCTNNYSYTSAHNLFICNPVTREYTDLPHFLDDDPYVRYTYGFGVSKMSGQYKLIRIIKYYSDSEPHEIKSRCEVYTLGTGLWRRIDASLPQANNWNSVGVFLNGNLHWLRFYEEGNRGISYFDLETEHVSSFSLPPLPDHRRKLWSLSALGDCLCLCDNSAVDEIDIWLMKEYGDDKSWIKEFIINRPLHHDSVGHLFPVKVLKDGDILFGEEQPTATRRGNSFF